VAIHPLSEFLPRLVRREDLSRDEAFDLLEALLDAEATDAQISGALVALAAKGETVDELTGMAEGLRSRAVRVISKHDCFIDTAGTGSSRAKTFNISTAAAFVIAGAGLPVAKHGNRAASSKSGSADLLTALGVNVSAIPLVSENALNEIGICFMFAPLFHGATARVAGERVQGEPSAVGQDATASHTGKIASSHSILTVVRLLVTSTSGSLIVRSSSGAPVRPTERSAMNALFLLLPLPPEVAAQIASGTTTRKTSRITGA